MKRIALSILSAAIPIASMVMFITTEDAYSQESVTYYWAACYLKSKPGSADISAHWIGPKTRSYAKAVEDGRKHRKQAVGHTPVVEYCKWTKGHSKPCGPGNGVLP